MSELYLIIQMNYTYFSLVISNHIVTPNYLPNVAAHLWVSGRGEFVSLYLNERWCLKELLTLQVLVSIYSEILFNFVACLLYAEFTMCCTSTKMITPIVRII